jgi:hypothetical protein
MYKQQRYDSHIVNAEDEPSIGNCIERSKIILQPEQQRVIKYMDKNDSMLVIHNIGKTISSICASECFLDKDPDNHTIIICPNTLIETYKMDMIKYGVKRDHAIRYSFYSYENFVEVKKNNKPIPCDDNTFLIIDEVHNLRDITSEIYNSVLECAMKSKKRLLLTATPFINFLTDFISLINLLYGKIYVDDNRDYIDYIDKNPTENNMIKIYHYLGGKIDIKELKQKDEKVLFVPMNNDYYKKYINLIKNDESPEKFLYSHKKAINEIGISEYIFDKLKATIPIIKSGRSFMITNYFEESIFKKVFDEENIKYNFNEEGVYLYEKEENEDIKNVIILEPTWNHTIMNQFFDKDIHIIISTPPENESLITGNQILYDIMKNKRNINKKIIDNLKKYCFSSSEKLNEYIIEEYNDLKKNIVEMVNRIPENISISEFSKMINRKSKNNFKNYIRIMKHIINDNDLIQKLNKIEKRADIYFKKKK